MSAFLDSNVLLDLFTADPVWGRWSERRIAELANRPVINGIVYAEVSIRFSSREVLDRQLSDIEIDLIEPGREALFAGR